MWQIQAQMALDLARERAREAEQQAIASRARAAQRREARLHSLERPGRGRRLAASFLRHVSDGFGSAADAACEAASRLDRRTA
jgi:hypothetical protein